MDRTRVLSLVVAIAETGGFARGGARLGLTPPVASRLVAELEADLGLALFQRSTRRVQLTAAGQDLVAAVRPALAEIEAALSSAAGQAVTPRGHLTITAPVTFGRLILAEVVAAFLAAHPGITASLLLVDRVVDLVEEGQDVALRIGVAGSQNARSLGLGVVHRIAVASPAYLDAAGPITDIRAHHRITFFADAHGAARLTVNDAATAVRLAVAGEGVVSLLSYQVAAELAAGTLIEVARLQADVPVRLVYPASRQPAAKLRAFLDFAAPRLRQVLGA